MRRIHKILYVISCIALVVSCDTVQRDLSDIKNYDVIDPEMGLTRDDYRKMSDIKSSDKNGETKTGVAGTSEPPVPDIAEILAAPKPPKLGETKLVSISVTDDVPLKDILIELARLAQVDIEIDSTITGGISFSAKDRPFNEVIERIADLAGLRYSIKNNVLRVERDTPYVQIYSLDFLNMDRSSTGNVNISTNVLSAGGGGGGSGSGGGSSSGSSGGSGGGSSGGSGGGGGGSGGLNTGSSASVTVRTDSDFWKQFEEGIKQILIFSESKRISSVDVASQPSLPATASSAAGGGAAATPAAAPAPVAAPAANGSKLLEGAFYIINKQASTLTISATDKQHDLIKRFLKKIQENVSSQVLIEAKIVEVTLNDEYQSGINWTQFGNSKLGFTGNFAPPATAVTNQANISIGKLGFTKGFDLTAAVQLVEQFGTTRTLSSPRLHATNNEEAVLTFAENHVYFEIQVTAATNSTVNGNTTSTPETVNSSLHTVPIGIIMTLQPSINLESNEVTLSVRPTLSRITGTVSDPAVAYLIATSPNPVSITNEVPVIEVRELDSILKLKSGQVMVIGGLMQDVANNTDRGIPGVAAIPILGNLFKGVDKTHNMSELVIFIRATIVDTSGGIPDADKNVYKKFMRDPRPLNF